mgnify:CR=1 FL=1
MKLNSTNRNTIRAIAVVIVLLCILTKVCTSGYEDSEASQEQKRRMEKWKQLKSEQEEEKKMRKKRRDAMRGPSPM